MTERKWRTVRRNSVFRAEQSEAYRGKKVFWMNNWPGIWMNVELDVRMSQCQDERRVNCRRFHDSFTKSINQSINQSAFV